MEFLKKSVLRTIKENRDLVENVTEIIRNVRDNGDDAILHYNIKFDGNGRRNAWMICGRRQSTLKPLPRLKKTACYR